jgi:hypothetical protein
MAWALLAAGEAAGFLVAGDAAAACCALALPGVLPPLPAALALAGVAGDRARAGCRAAAAAATDDDPTARPARGGVLTGARLLLASGKPRPTS